MKEAGHAVPPAVRPRKNTKVGPRIVISKARRGFLHPLSRQDIRQALEIAGAEAVYGLKRVELCRAPDSSGCGRLPLGRLYPGGRIVLYEQPVPPWRIRNKLSEASLKRLESAGAIVTSQIGSFTTVIEWPEGTFREFMLFDVFLHELGHHVLQHNKGKRPVRIARSRDHEAFAERFARKCRKGPSGSLEIAGDHKNLSRSGK